MVTLRNITFQWAFQVQYNTLVLTEEMVMERVKDAEKTVKQRDENASEEVLLRLTSTEGVAGKDNIEKLETRIRKRKYDDTKGRTKKQYAGTTKRLKLKLEKMRVKLKNFRTMWQHKEAKKIVDTGDVIIWNPLDMQQILKDSKSEYKKLNSTARKNASVVAPGMFTEKMMWQVRKTEGKKYVKGEGEKGTSKTCTKCGWWKPGLGGAKTYVCTNCGFRGNRDAAGARNNLLEKLQQIWGAFVGWFQNHVLPN